MRIAERFEKLPLYQKIEVALLVLFFYIAILYFYEKSLKNKLILDPSTTFQTANMEKFSNKIEKFSNNDAILFLEKKLTQFQLKNSNLKFQKNNIALKIEGSFEQIINFLNTIENHMDIVSFDLQSQKNSLKLDLVVGKTFLYNKLEKTPTLHFDTNPFYHKQKVIAPISFEKKFEPPKIVLDAIVFDEVIYQDNWYRLGDMIEDNKIIAIKKDKVIFLNGGSKKKFSVKVVNE